ncbi:methyltransferase family protein [Denitrificimonas caeni]|uniref:Isoprenylcysteine carboxylmethyltransferase family protein n=1 Tax=Denitrificimonas caeni TaxID=521720 RepID=A0AAF0AKR9_9GAMM|nr:isoprenylcysteine carboxylmethyltransferase family protein [Denitrificimonas caeni]WBE24733.1 isoprenylcysteine carboxylmethyltransferase family protein [Denitrificimonas caeni]
MRKPYFILPAPLVYVAFFLLAWVLSSIWPWPLPENPWTLFFGWMAIDASVLLMLWTAWLMLWRKTTLNPYGKPQQLLTEGPFRVTRNPIYVADTLFYMGAALLFADVWVWLFLPVVLVAVSFGVIRHEERLLMQHFGDDYRNYMNKVRRWL